MATFALANQARLSLKMKLSNYCWYAGSSVEANGDDYMVMVYIGFIDNEVRKVIPTVHMGVGVKTDVHHINRKQRRAE